MWRICHGLFHRLRHDLNLMFSSGSALHPCRIDGEWANKRIAGGATDIGNQAQQSR
jgi:hypothetical protein